MTTTQTIKYFSVINNNEAIVNIISCLMNFATINKKNIIAFLFLFSFWINAQVFVSDSTLVRNKDLVAFSETNKSEVFIKESEATIFISKGTIIVHTEQLANTQVIYESNKVSKPSNQEISAENLVKTKKKIEKIVSFENKKEKSIVFGYKSNENKNHVSYFSLSESFVVLPNYHNDFKPFMRKGFVLQLPPFDYSKIHTNHSLLVVDYHPYFLDDYQNRPPPFFG